MRKHHWQDITHRLGRGSDWLGSISGRERIESKIFYWVFYSRTKILSRSSYSSPCLSDSGVNHQFYQNTERWRLSQSWFQTSQPEAQDSNVQLRPALLFHYSISRQPWLRRAGVNNMGISKQTRPVLVVIKHSPRQQSLLEIPPTWQSQGDLRHSWTPRTSRRRWSRWSESCGSRWLLSCRDLQYFVACGSWCPERRQC